MFTSGMSRYLEPLSEKAALTVRAYKLSTHRFTSLTVQRHILLVRGDHCVGYVGIKDGYVPTVT